MIEVHAPEACQPTGSGVLFTILLHESTSTPTYPGSTCFVQPERLADPRMSAAARASVARRFTTLLYFTLPPVSMVTWSR